MYTCTLICIIFSTYCLHVYVHTSLSASMKCVHTYVHMYRTYVPWVVFVCHAKWWLVRDQVMRDPQLSVQRPSQGSPQTSCCPGGDLQL